MPSHKDRLNGLRTQHRQFLAQAQSCIDNDMAKSENVQLAELMARLSKKIKAHILWLDRPAGQGDHKDDEAVSWGPITTARKSIRKGSQIQLIVTGPSPEDSLAIKVDKKTDDIEKLEAQIQVFDKMSKALARAVEQHQSILALHEDDSLADGGDAPDEDQARISLLKRYNDVRDVAQQLIGIIAENEQVSVRSIYKDGRFGVGADD